MKKSFVIVIAVGLFLLGGAEGAKAAAQNPELGAGLILGAPTGLSVKYWMPKNQALDAGLGFPFDSDVQFSFHTDYLWQIPTGANVPGELPFYMGLGLRLRAVDRPDETQKIDFGFRIPVGLEFSPRNVPLNFFAELAPVVVFIPKGKLDLDGGVGVRYRFGASESKK